MSDSTRVYAYKGDSISHSDHRTILQLRAGPTTPLEIVRVAVTWASANDIMNRVDMTRESAPTTMDTVDIEAIPLVIGDPQARLAVGAVTDSGRRPTTEDGTFTDILFWRYVYGPASLDWTLLEEERIVVPPDGLIALRVSNGTSIGGSSAARAFIYFREIAV
jgi:hypothetical protein